MAAVTHGGAIRAYAAQENQLNLKVRGKITASGALTGTLEMSGSGQADTRLRRSLGQGRLRGHRDQGVEPVVQRLDAAEEMPRQLDAAQLAVAQRVGEFGQG